METGKVDTGLVLRTGREADGPGCAFTELRFRQQREEEKGEAGGEGGRKVRSYTNE